jgi:hypothetical protein
MINPIAHTVPAYNRGANNYLWLPIPTPEGEMGNDWHDYVAVGKEHLKMDNPLLFIYKYYEAIDEGECRLRNSDRGQQDHLAVLIRFTVTLAHIARHITCFVHCDRDVEARSRMGHAA